MRLLLYVFIGGGLGSICRYGISQLWSSNQGHYGTLTANIISCLILGVLIGLNADGILKNEHRLLLMTGFCGGFSTFSTFSAELVQLYQGDQIVSTLGHLALSIVAGVVSILAGIFIARAILSMS